MFEVLYYPHGNDGPVAEYLGGLAKERPKAFARLVLDLEILGAEGLRSGQITIRPLGNKLWELKRLYEGIQYLHSTSKCNTSGLEDLRWSFKPEAFPRPVIQPVFHGMNLVL